MYNTQPVGNQSKERREDEKNALVFGCKVKDSQ